MTKNSQSLEEDFALLESSPKAMLHHLTIDIECGAALYQMETGSEKESS
jgi:hypothetical protein